MYPPEIFCRFSQSGRILPTTPLKSECVQHSWETEVSDPDRRLGTERMRHPLVATHQSNDIHSGVTSYGYGKYSSSANHRPLSVNRHRQHRLTTSGNHETKGSSMPITYDDQFKRPHSSGAVGSGIVGGMSTANGHTYQTKNEKRNEVKRNERTLPTALNLTDSLPTATHMGGYHSGSTGNIRAD